MPFFKTPYIIQWLFPKIVWNVKTEVKVIYLTFDDGPIPEVTEFVLCELEKYNAKATFFCIGDNLQKHPSIFEQVLQKGHSIGNHSFNHLKGWNTKNAIYFENIEHCNKLTQSELFRPPYGKIKLSQIKELQKKYKIIFWDVLSYDFDITIDKEKALENIIKHTKKGSIIVFHDSLKAYDNLQFLLPKFLEHFSNLGYSFKSL